MCVYKQHGITNTNLNFHAIKNADARKRQSYKHIYVLPNTHTYPATPEHILSGGWGKVVSSQAPIGHGSGGQGLNPLKFLQENPFFRIKIHPILDRAGIIQEQRSGWNSLHEIQVFRNYKMN